MLKKLILKNVQAHAHLELALQQGINVIYGKTNAGKSSIIRAIRWWAFDDFPSDALRRKKTKETSVTGEFESGIVITRIRSNTVNAYEVTKPGDEKPSRYDAIGRAGVPEDIQKLFGMNLFEVDKVKTILNVGEQFSSPFLLGKEYASTFRAKLFNQLTGHDLQDKVFKDLNKDLMNFSKELTTIEKQSVDLVTEKNILEQDKTVLDEKYSKAVNNLEYINDLKETYDQYVLVSAKIESNNDNANRIKTSIGNIKTLSLEILNKIREKLLVLESYKNQYTVLNSVNESLKPVVDSLRKVFEPFVDLPALKEKILRLQDLKTVEGKLSAINYAIKDSQTRFVDLKIVEIDSNKMHQKFDMVDYLKDLSKRINDNKAGISFVEQQLKDLSEKMAKDTLTLEEAKKRFTLCPLCDKVVSKEDIEKLKEIK